ncbi:Hypothetical predicted protein [Paramuricea clavata]|uniref:Uncharacterized protein n=1 Tax=Paramuricea clavata TaxID=317549 RepID=A0A7D9I1U7_PARCT|nr:Hypothetical predicted protein [Paramuricea clavata]
MSKTMILIIALCIVLIAKSDATAQSKTPTEISPSVMKGIKSTGETVGAKLTELFLNRYLPKNSFTILITNSMVKRRLIDPKIYLKNGKTTTPPSFMIPAAQDPYSGTKHIALLENDPAGVLCYDNEPSTAQPNVEKAVSCVILDAKEKQYALYAQHEAITLNEMETLYKKYEKRSDDSIKPTINQNGGFLFKDYQQFRMIAQLTTGGKVRQLHFEVILELLSNSFEINLFQGENTVHGRAMGILKVSFALLERINCSGSTCQRTSGKVCAVDASCWLHKALAVSFKDLAMIATLL